MSRLQHSRQAGLAVAPLDVRAVVHVFTLGGIHTKDRHTASPVSPLCASTWLDRNGNNITRAPFMYRTHAATRLQTRASSVSRAIIACACIHRLDGLQTIILCKSVCKWAEQNVGALLNCQPRSNVGIKLVGREHAHAAFCYTVQMRVRRNARSAKDNLQAA